MRAGMMLSVAGVMAAAVVCWAGAPKLARCEPANGAKGVAVDVGALRLFFDQDMKQNQWTLMRSGRGEFPPTDPGAGALWVDSRTFELRLGRLKPGTTYAVQLNSDRRQGFRSAAENAALAVTVVTFTTEGGAPPAGPATAAPGAASDAGGAPPATAKAFSASDLEGDWRHKSQAVEITLKLLAGGRYESATVIAGAAHEAKGRWRVEEGELVCAPEAGGEPLRQKIESLGKDNLELSQAGGQRLKFSRAAAAQGIVGAWLCVQGEAEVRAAFGADGKCSYSVKSADGGQESAKGTYTFGGGTLVIRPEGQEESITFTAKLADANTLDLTDAEGNTARLLRQGAGATPDAKAKTEAARPQAEEQGQAEARQLVGSWVLRTEDGELHAVFGTDGRCSYVQRTADGEERHEAAWRFADGALVIQPRDGAAERFRVRFPSRDVMVMVGESGETVTLARQGR